MKRLAVITTHPIQYYAPVFRLLSKCLQIKVFYTWGEKSIESKFDPGFGKVVKWDLPLLEDYPYEFMENISSDPGSHHFNGIKNPDLIKKIIDFAPDDILIYGWAYSSHLRALRYFKNKIPIWFRGDSTLEDSDFEPRKLLRYFFLRWVYGFVDHAFFVGTANKRYYKKFGLSEEQLHFAPHAVDITRFQSDRADEAQELRAKYNIGKQDILILFAGKLEPKKDPEILLDAFSNLEQNNTHLLFAGDGVLKQKLLEKRKNSHKEQRIHFLEFQNQQQMPVLYQACDLFCLPSKGPGETWGLAVNEAMACGKTILISDKVGCSEDLVIEGYNGAIFKHGSASQLQEKIIHLTDVKELEKMGQNSLAIIKEWTLEKQVSTIEKCLKLDAK
jgi:glycosyltransferase involved in cell wall biosynthesis